jgi:predicted NUDIX family phosphoesterase
VLAYQRRVTHSEARLGGLWSVGFGGHIEPLDRQEVGGIAGGLVKAAALRELTEETGLQPSELELQRIGYINSDQDDVSSVHFGVVYLVNLDAYPAADEQIKDVVCRQAEPFQARWLYVSTLKEIVTTPRKLDGSDFENWSRITIKGLYQAEPPNNQAQETSA